MSIDTSALNTQARFDALVARLDALDAEEAEYTSSASVSDQGRTINFGAALDAIAKRREAIRKELALIAGPSFQISRVRV